MKNVLFFGDSNTWGYNPENGLRYPYELRWTSVAARELGEEYNCIPAGLNGRTTVFDDIYRPGLNGRKALDNELQSHKPLDLCVIMLGTNDLKFGNAEQITRGMDTLINMVKSANERYNFTSPVFPDGVKLLVVSPIFVHEKTENNPELDLMPMGHIESRRLKELYAALAEAQGVEFLAASDYAQPCELDCQHMLPDGHEALGGAMAQKIREILA